MPSRGPFSEPHLHVQASIPGMRRSRTARRLPVVACSRSSTARRRSRRRIHAPQQRGSAHAPRVIVDDADDGLILVGAHGSVAAPSLRPPNATRITVRHDRSRRSTRQVEARRLISHETLAPPSPASDAPAPQKGASLYIEDAMALPHERGTHSPYEKGRVYTSILGKHVPKRRTARNWTLVLRPHAQTENAASSRHCVGVEISGARSSLTDAGFAEREVADVR